MKEADNLDNNIEQSTETAEPPTHLSRADTSAVHEVANKLLQELQGVPNGYLVGEIVANALKLLRDETNRGDIKLIDYVVYKFDAKGNYAEINPGKGS